MTTALICIIGSPAFGIVIGLSISGKCKHDPYLIVVGCCFCLGVFFAVLGLICNYSADKTLYDLKFQAHYVDGSTQVFQRDSTEMYPKISTNRGSYYLHFDKIYVGVCRIEMIYCREYKVPPKVWSFVRQ